MRTVLLFLPAVLLGLAAGSGLAQTTALHRFDGAAAGDGLGISVAGAGDVNQDGWADVIAGAYNADPGGRTDAGQATVFSGKDGSILYRFDGLAAGNWFGWSVAGAGDVNRDGFPDLVVGAYRADPGGRTAAGQAMVLSGKDGAALYLFDGPAAGDRLGIAVVGADVNRDGHADLIVGAYSADPGGRSNAGQATVFSGKDGSILYRFDGRGAGDELGWSVAAADVDRDGYPDVIVGACSADPGGRTDAGQVTVYSGKDGSMLRTFDGLAAGDRFGMAVAAAADVDRDGHPDVIVGAYRADPGGRTDAGQATVFSGKDGRILHTLDGPVAGDHFGRSVAGADLDRDGYGDILVGGDNASPGNRTGAGQAAAFSGRTGSLLFTCDGVAAGDCLGVSVADAGDVNRDGALDFVVGADMADPGSRTDAGQATVFSARGIPTISGTGSPAVGGVLTLALASPGDANLPYQVGSSLTAGTIPIDRRLLYLGMDALLVVTVQGQLPTVFSRYGGFLDASAKATAAIHTPRAPALVGLRIHSAFVTVKAGAPSNLESISNTFFFDVTP
ncbi:MAG: FG-GAP repeat protein [Planctomycetes bacterium]|nr:FG-GAP repeat protein [Planctomycetota bacterium]